MRTRVAVFLLLTILAGLLIGGEVGSAKTILPYNTQDGTSTTKGTQDASKIDDSKINTSRSIPTSYFTAVEKYGDNIEWLSFSFTDYEVEREIVRKYFAQTITEIENGKYGPPNDVKIAIAKADINGDSHQEVIWILCHRYFRSAKTSGSLGIFTYKDGNLEFIRLPQVWVPEAHIEEQREVGIRDNPTSKWKDFFLNGNLWRWSENGYFPERQ